MLKNLKQTSKKGAMFGLDARITLVVLSSLALVATASLYNAARKANSVRFLSELESVAQAYKNFKHDTKYDLNFYSNPYYYNINQLINLTQDPAKPYTLKYNGPYIDYVASTSSNFIKNPILDKNFAIINRSYKNSWSSATKTQKCADTDCFKWVVLSDLEKQHALAIDLQVDKKISATTGKLRTEANGSNLDVFYLIEKQ